MKHHNKMDNSGPVPQRNENRCSHRTWTQMYTELSNCKIAKKWKQVKCPSTDAGLQNVAHLQNGMLFTKESNTNTGHHTEKPRKILCGAKEARHKRCMLCNSIYMTCPKSANLQRQKVDWAGLGDLQGDKVASSEHQGLFGGSENVLE